MAPSVEINRRNNTNLNLHAKEKLFFSSSNINMANGQNKMLFEKTKGDIEEKTRTYRAEKQFSTRKEEAAAIRNKFPTKVPIIVDRFHKESSLPQLERSKFLVPQEITMSQFVTIISRRPIKVIEILFASAKNERFKTEWRRIKFGNIDFLSQNLYPAVEVCLQMDETALSRYTRREVFYFHNTLLCLVKALEKRYTTIDLRNETNVTGKIIEVDGFMNITLTDAALYDTDGEMRYFQNLHLQARNIRNVHIPDNVNILKAIKSQVTKEESRKSSKGKMTFKQSRAKKQQKETLELIKKMKKEKNVSATSK